jgi:hypothetical protein
MGVPNKIARRLTRLAALDDAKRTLEARAQEASCKRRTYTTSLHRFEQYFRPASIGRTSPRDSDRVCDMRQSSPAQLILKITLGNYTRLGVLFICQK